MIFDRQFDPDVYDDYKKWIPWIKEVFLPSIDDKGFIKPLFEPLGTLEQPFITMSILHVIQYIYFQKHASPI